MYLAQRTNWGHFPDRIGIWTCLFLRRGENRSKLLIARADSQKILQTPSESWYKKMQETTQKNYQLYAVRRAAVNIVMWRLHSTIPVFIFQKTHELVNLIPLVGLREKQHKQNGNRYAKFMKFAFSHLITTVIILTEITGSPLRSTV